VHHLDGHKKKLLDRNVFIASQFVSTLSDQSTNSVKNIYLIVREFVSSCCNNFTYFYGDKSPIQRVPGTLSQGVKRPRREADHSPRTNAEVKKVWIYTSTPPIRLHIVVLN
jgi:hypothetical protein